MQAVLPTWRFFRAGGFDQVRLDTAAELLAIDQLDQKLWVALSCPVKGIEFDAPTCWRASCSAPPRRRSSASCTNWWTAMPTARFVRRS